MIRKRGNYRVFLPTRSFLTSFGHCALEARGLHSQQPTPQTGTPALLEEVGSLLQVEETPRGIPEVSGVQGGSGAPWAQEPACWQGQDLPLQDTSPLASCEPNCTGPATLGRHPATQE